MTITPPDGAQAILRALTRAGYRAYLVGGCVRDSLLGKTPKDWDICASARPEQVRTCLPAGYIPLDVGLRHGTVAAVAPDGTVYEVTTFRADGPYSDHRHPDKVTFVTDLAADLARRDFTVNAMAYAPGEGLVDPFGGREDLRNNILRCVGEPGRRFREDALRVLRALRFASIYGLRVEEGTAAALHENGWRLRHIAPERVRAELCGLLCGGAVLRVLLEYSDVMAVVLPELRPCIGFNQNSKYHCYTVYDHMAHAVAAYTGEDVSVRAALLLHDIGKPSCYTEDENGGHFYGHAKRSRELAQTAVERLRFDNRSKQEILELIQYHDTIFPPHHKTVRRWLNRLGRRRMEQLMEVRLADMAAHTEGTQEAQLALCRETAAVLEQVLREQQCFSMKDLAVDGRDVMALGVPEGPEVGRLLSALLEKVIEGELENKRDALLRLLERRK